MPNKDPRQGRDQHPVTDDRVAFYRRLNRAEAERVRPRREHERPGVHHARVGREPVVLHELRAPVDPQARPDRERRPEPERDRTGSDDTFSALRKTACFESERARQNQSHPREHQIPAPPA